MFWEFLRMIDSPFDLKPDETDAYLYSRVISLRAAMAREKVLAPYKVAKSLFSK